MMKYQEFAELVDASRNKSMNDFVADNVCYPVQELVTIWTMGHDGITIKSLASAFQRSARNIGMTYGIIERTIMSWSAGTSKPKEWQIKTLAYALLSDNM